MLVNLLPISDPALSNQRAGAASVSAAIAPTAAFRDERDDLHERVRRDEQREENQIAALTATRPADVITEAERNIEGSSRAFRRQVAHETGTEQFRQDRQAFRQALTDANGRQPAAAPRESAKPTPQSDTRPQTEGGRQPRTPVKAPSPASPESAKIPASQQAAQANGATAARVPAAGASLAALTGQNARTGNVSSMRAIGARVIQSIATGTTPLSNAATVVKSSGNGGVRGGTVSPTAAAPARGSARNGSVFSLRTSDPRSAESTARDANVERIVRVIRNRLSGDRSHTVIRLDPPELGRVRLQMDLRGASLVLQVDTTTELAHRLLSKDLEKLRDGLESSGIQLARVEIRPPTTVPDTNEQNPSQQADTRDDTQGGSAQADAEHPQEHGKDSHPAGSVQNVTRELNQEPAMESLVNVVA